MPPDWLPAVRQSLIAPRVPGPPSPASTARLCRGFSDRGGEQGVRAKTSMSRMGGGYAFFASSPRLTEQLVARGVRVASGAALGRARPNTSVDTDDEVAPAILPPFHDEVLGRWRLCRVREARDDDRARRERHAAVRVRRRRLVHRDAGEGPGRAMLARDRAEDAKGVEVGEGRPRLGWGICLHLGRICFFVSERGAAQRWRRARNQSSCEEA